MSSNPTMATAAFRLSSQQERAWAEHELGIAQTAQAVIGIEGALDSARLKTALQSLVAKYEILRTVLRRQSGVKLPFQVIQEGAAFAFAQNTGNVADWLRRERESLGGIEHGPTLRALLLSTSTERHTLILTIPAFCADAATLNNLFNEICVAYGGRSADSDEVMQYADLVEWQNELLASDESKPGRDFWRQACREIDFPAVASLSLPLENKSEAAFAHDSLTISFPTTKIGPVAAQIKVTPASVLMAAWIALLGRLLGAAEVVAGCEFDGRRYEELASVLGPLARTLPLRIETRTERPFAELAQSVGAVTNEARNWQESFAWAQATDVEHPSLPLSFSYAELEGEARVAGGVKFGLERVEVISERFKLRLHAEKRGAELTLNFDYDAARFERSAVERIAGYYQNLLQAALANPATPIAKLPLLSEAERRQLLVEWNQTAAAYPQDQCLHEFFERQAAANPDRIAVRTGAEALTYRELNERSNQLAHYLRKQGVGPDERVGLALERSPRMMVAVLAIMKAGGAYGPVNADNPAARTKQQLAGAKALLTETKFLGQMPEFAGTTIVLDRKDDEKLWAQEATSNPATNTTPENLAYLIYTSGSTGVPKGVAVRHRNLVNYADFIAKKLRLSEHRDGLQLATVSTLGADLGNTCIYPALISGGTLHVLPHEVATDPQQFADYAAKYPIDVLKIVPSHLSALLQSQPEEAQKILPRKYLITGGEALTPTLLDKIATVNYACEILNHYGPTETTVGSLTLELKSYDWKNAGLVTIPIGRPIQNTQVYVLDASLEPVPVGVTGELYIAGAGVTAGYLGQAEKTAERFVKNPFANQAGSEFEKTFGKTMYRTGDLARYGADGNIEFLGRGDDQVKIRGFRIELGEIEAVLGQHAAVKQAVVLARASAANSDDKRLLAYVVLHREAATNQNGHGAVTSETLRQHLQQHVPDYMVPQVMLLQKLPLNANGKLDRQALPEPEQAAAQKVYVAPRTATEQAIAAIWAEVLRRDAAKIGADDNFFDLGGHSLLATQVVSRQRRALTIELPLRTLFESPTVAALAEQCDKFSASAQPEVPEMVRVPRNHPLPRSFAQHRLWVLDRIEPNNPLYNIPRATRLMGNLNVLAMINALNEMVRRHESQRTTFSAGADGQPVQMIAESLRLDVPVQDLSARPDREDTAQQIATEEARTPFNLATGPLLRARLLRLGAAEHVLLLTMHHIVSDAWSSAIFFRELGELYTAFLEGKPSPLPELALQYADYAVWQRNYLQGKVLDAQLSYWREHLRGAPALLQLPSDRPRPEVRKFDGAYEQIPLAKDVAAGIKTFCANHGVTPFMTMLAAFNALLSRYSGEQHIVLGTDIANRTTAETERMIGFFINLLPVHTDLSGDPTFRELVLRVRESALGAYAHQDIPFDKLVEDLQPERSLSHNPIVQALFVMQNIPPQGREFAGLEFAPFPASVTRSKFDVGVFIRENAMGTFQDWLYSTELFERSTILRMPSHYENLLRHALTQPEVRLSGLEIYSPEEKHRMDQEQAERKQTQRKKLISAAPKAVNLGATEKK